MKTAVIFADGIKQIMFTPENKSEKFALSLITPDDDIELLLKEGNMYSHPQNLKVPFTANMNMCEGNYLRIYENNKESRILVLKPKKKK